MHSHQLYAANLVKRTTAAGIFDLAWTEEEPEAEGGTRRRRRTSAATEGPSLRDLHDTILLYADAETVQTWGQRLAEAAGLEPQGRPITWALALGPLLAEIPEPEEAETETERTNGHLAPVA